jgi:hypothetical protein
MKLKPYREMLKWGKGKIDESLAPVRANKAKKQAELEVAKMEEKIATQEAKIEELCTQKELDFHAIIEAQDALALMERKRKQFLTIITELFP